MRIKGSSPTRIARPSWACPVIRNHFLAYLLLLLDNSSYLHPGYLIVLLDLPWLSNWDVLVSTRSRDGPRVALISAQHASKRECPVACVVYLCCSGRYWILIESSRGGGDFNQFRDNAASTSQQLSVVSTQRFNFTTIPFLSVWLGSCLSTLFPSWISKFGG